MFTNKIYPIIFNGVENIGVKYIITKRISTVIWSWTEDEVQLHTYKFDNLLYF